MPRRRAVATTDPAPTSAVSSAETVFSDRASAVGQGDRAEIVLGVVLRCPVADADRLIDADGVRPQAVLERGEVDEGLERRAGLAARVDGAVERALGIVAAADQRPDRTVRVHRDEGALADAIGAAFLVERVGEGPSGVGLEIDVDRGLDDDVDIDRADEVGQHVHHPVGDVTAAAAGDVADRLDLLRHGDARVAVGDVAGIAHGGDDQAGARLGSVAVEKRRIAPGSLEQAGERRRPRRWSRPAPTCRNSGARRHRRHRRRRRDRRGSDRARGSRSSRGSPRARRKG